jgi:hypothetical protein
MIGVPKDGVTDEVVSSVGSDVNLEGPGCAGRNFRNPDRSSGLKVKKIHNITERNIT